MSGTSPVFGRTAQQAELAPVREEERTPFSPAEGWIALGALSVMVVTMAIAIDDATWAGYIPDTKTAQTSFLSFGALLAVLVGTLLAKSRLSPMKAHAAGAVVGAAYLLLAISNVVSTSTDLLTRIRALGESVNLFAYEVIVLGLRSSETSVFLLTIGAVVWTTGQFAGFSVFRRHRVLPAMLVAAIPLLVNVSVTVRDQYLHVIVFAAAALLLMMRLNLFGQVRAWRSRAIAEGEQVAGPFMRAGSVFITLALVGSIALAANTSSAPLGAAWTDLEDQLVQVGFEVNRVLGGVSGAARGPSALFAPSQTMREVWESSDAIEFTANTTEPGGHRYRGAVYDVFDGRTWQAANRSPRMVGQGEDVLGPSAESVAQLAGRHEVIVEITPDEIGGHVMVAPDGPLHVTSPVEVTIHLESDDLPGGFVASRLPQGMVQGVPYTIRAMVPTVDGEDALTGNQLAAAGVTYDYWVRRYTDIREGSIGQRTYDVTASIVAGLPDDQRDPYHVAEAIQNYLRRTGGFLYKTDVRGFCTYENYIDCFLQVKQGFCEWFAGAMVMMLRTQGIPARYVMGYLPGRQLDDGRWEVPRSAAHAWVEVYFPGYGWITFDPTPGNEENSNVQPRLDAGPPVATPRPPDVAAPSPTFLGPDDDEGIFRPLPGTNPQLPGGGGASGLVGPLAVIGLLAAIGLLVLAVGLRRAPRTEPELAYSGVTRLARRLGYGPRPSQTAYEFADGLGEVVPAVRGELKLVATAKVESAYGRRELQGEALRALRDAYRRVRMGLLRLVFRRPRGPRGPRAIDQR
jgi:hypothetical protein